MPPESEALLFTSPTTTSVTLPPVPSPYLAFSAQYLGVFHYGPRQLG